MATPDYNNPPSGIPTDKVLEMRNSGLSNNQIIQNLQREGFTQTQIFDAMNQAEIKVGVQQAPPESLSSYEPANPMTMGENIPLQASSQEIGMPPLQAQGMQQQGSVSTEELIEALIDEKWNELVKDINKVVDWKDKTETRITKMEQGFEDLKKSFDNLHKAVVGKIGEYDKHILDVGAEIQAMEKVFQKVLPTFTDNVKELSRITDNMKKK